MEKAEIFYRIEVLVTSPSGLVEAWIPFVPKEWGGTRWIWSELSLVRDFVNKYLLEEKEQGKVRLFRVTEEILGV